MHQHYKDVWPCLDRVLTEAVQLCTDFNMVIKSRRSLHCRKKLWNNKVSWRIKRLLFCNKSILSYKILQFCKTVQFTMFFFGFKRLNFNQLVIASTLIFFRFRCLDVCLYNKYRQHEKTCNILILILRAIVYIIYFVRDFWKQRALIEMIVF